MPRTWPARGHNAGVTTGPGDDEPVLPDQTADDTDAGWGEGRDREDGTGGRDDDERLLRERPPHWE